MHNKKPIFIYIITALVFLATIYVFVNATLITYGIISGNIDFINVSEVSQGNGKTTVYSGGILKMTGAYTLSIFLLILGLGILYRKNWARITLIIFLILVALSILPGLTYGNIYGTYIGNVIWLAISTSIATYLITSRKVKNTFKKRRPKT